jgi:hypothetical protein
VGVGAGGGVAVAAGRDVAGGIGVGDAFICLVAGIRRVWEDDAKGSAAGTVDNEVDC